MAKSLKRKITDKITIDIVPVNSSVDLQQRVWAINWFNYKKKWLYTLYNRLAVRNVIKVGGQLLFKGHNRQTLFGDETLARETLLVVTYPKIDNFLDMLTIKAFQVKSLLRVKAVKNFVFGFMKRVDTNTMNISRNTGTYLVWHYQGNIDKHLLRQLLDKYHLNLFFQGEKLAQLKRSEQGKEDVIPPLIMDGIVLLKPDSPPLQYKEFIDDETFNNICAGNKSNYVAIFDREK